MDLFFELLQVATGHRVQLTVFPTEIQWEALLDESERQAVASYMMDGLERLPLKQLPPIQVKLQWIGLLQITEQTIHEFIQTLDVSEAVKAELMAITPWNYTGI